MTGPPCTLSQARILNFQITLADNLESSLEESFTHLEKQTYLALGSKLSRRLACASQQKSLNKRLVIIKQEEGSALKMQDGYRVIQ